jgi:hypothetical protein
VLTWLRWGAHHEAAVISAGSTAGALLIIGSLVFDVGAAIGVPSVFTERDAAERLRMLERRAGSWRLAQPLYGLGSIIAAVGVGFLAADSSQPGTSIVFAIASFVLIIGALPWVWSLYLRRRDRLIDSGTELTPGS